jgi:hypothetical protein
MLVAWLVAPLVIDYFAYATRLGASARRAAHRSSSATSPTLRVWVPRHVARLIARRRLLRLRRASGCLGTSRGSSLVVDNSASRRLVARLVAPLVVDYSASRGLVVDYSASRRLVVDYFAYAVHLGASARRGAHRSSSTTPHRACSSRGSLRRSSSTTSSTPRIRVPRHIVRPVTRLIVDCSVRRDFVSRQHWLYFEYVARRRLPVASRRPFISTSFPN